MLFTRDESANSAGITGTMCGPAANKKIGKIDSLNAQGKFNGGGCIVIRSELLNTLGSNDLRRFATRLMSPVW